MCGGPQAVTILVETTEDTDDEMAPSFSVDSEHGPGVDLMSPVSKVSSNVIVFL